MSDTGPILPSPEFSDDALRNLCYADPVFRQRYEGWEYVGRGAYATVVKVRFMGEPVALKVFGHLTDDGRRRFQAEFANAVRLASPNVVRTYSAFEHGAVAWIEMEIVDGPNLRQELERRQQADDPFSLEEGIEIGQAVASVLAEAHEARVVHRDIKPANILLPRSKRPVAKLGDFGIARFSGAAKLTATGAFPGTPHFGAPEAFAGKPLGPKADVYSLSLCLYALFTNNRFPWILEDDCPLETLIAVHVKMAPLPMRHFVPALPEELDALVLKGLDKSPESRPSAAELVRALELLRRRASPAPQQNGAGLSIHPRMLALSALLVVGVVVGALRHTKAGGTPLPPTAAVPSKEPDPQGLGKGGSAAPQSEGLALRGRLHGDFLHIVNEGAPLSELRVTLVTARGTEHSLEVPGILQSGETSDLAVDAFSPPPDSHTQVQEVWVSGKGPTGRTRSRVGLEELPTPLR